MRALVTRLRADNMREKALVTNWPEPEEPQDHEIKTRTLYTGITNGTDHNHLVGGSYAHADDELPACWGYQTVGRIIATGPGVHTLNVGDLLYRSAAPMEYVVMPEDGLLIRLPETVEPTHAALFGMASVAMHACRTADLRLGERVLLVGQGCIGQIAAQIATVMGPRSRSVILILNGWRSRGRWVPPRCSSTSPTTAGAVTLPTKRSTLSSIWRVSSAWKTISFAPCAMVAASCWWRGVSMSATRSP